MVTATYACRPTAYSCTNTGNTHNQWPVAATTNNHNNIARTSSSSYATLDRPHPTPLSSTSTKPIEDISVTSTEPETDVSIPTEPHITTIRDETKITIEQTTEDFVTTEPATQDSTEVESTTFEPIVDDSNRTVSGWVSNQSGVIAGVVLAIFAVIFLVVITTFLVGIIIVKQNKKSSLAHNIKQFQDISNGN